MSTAELISNTSSISHISPSSWSISIRRFDSLDPLVPHTYESVLLPYHRPTALERGTSRRFDKNDTLRIVIDLDKRQAVRDSLKCPVEIDSCSWVQEDPDLAARINGSLLEKAGFLYLRISMGNGMACSCDKPMFLPHIEGARRIVTTLKKNGGKRGYWHCVIGLNGPAHVFVLIYFDESGTIHIAYEQPLKP